MTRITFNGFVYVKITKEEWMFAGGETNPDLLKLRHKGRERRVYRYFRLRDGVNVGTVPQPAPMTEDEKFLAGFCFE